MIHNIRALPSYGTSRIFPIYPVRYRYPIAINRIMAGMHAGMCRAVHPAAPPSRLERECGVSGIDTRQPTCGVTPLVPTCTVRNSAAQMRSRRSAAMPHMTDHVTDPGLLRAAMCGAPPRNPARSARLAVTNWRSPHGPPMKRPPRNEVDANAPDGLPRDRRLRLPIVLCSDA